MTTSTKDFSDYLAEASSAGVTYIGEALKRIPLGLANDIESINAVASAIAKDYQKFSDTAVKFAGKAGNAGDAAGQKLFTKIAQTFQDAAGQKTALGSQKFLEKVSAEAKAASAELGGKLVGPALDGAKIGIGAIDAVSTGNTSELGKASASTLAGAGGAALGAAVVGVLVGYGVIAASAWT